MNEKCETESGGYPANPRHHYFRDQRNEEGYAICDACGCSENSALAAHYCRWWINEQIGVLLQGNEPPFDESSDYIGALDMENEEQCRLYYQDIVYHICNCLDRIQGRKVTEGRGIVCGTVGSPTTEVQDAMTALEAENKRLRRAARDILDAWRSGENPADYDSTVDDAVKLFGGRE